MNRGKYHHQITFQTATETSDGQGGATTAFTTLATQWASVIPLSGERLIRMQQIVQGNWYQIETNYRADLAATIKLGNPILFNSRSLYVKSFADVEEGQMTWNFLAYEKRA